MARVSMATGAVPPPAGAGGLAHLRKKSGIQWRRWAPALPAAAAVTVMFLTEVTRRMAVGAGHVDMVLQNTTIRVQYPPVSPATRLPPERWVWTIGVVTVWALLICPSLKLLWEIFRRSPEPCLSKHIFALMPIGSLFLLGEACIPLQPDIMGTRRVLVNTQSVIHLTCAGCFFTCFLLHAPAVTIWQFFTPAERRLFGPASMRIKTAIVALGLLSLFGVVPVVLLLLLCPPQDDTARSRAQSAVNFAGLGQRSIVVCINLFLGSYGLEIRSLQRQGSLARAEGEECL